MIKHTVGDGKYTIVFYDKGNMEAFRYGILWRDLTGDGLVLSMLQEIDNLKQSQLPLVVDESALVDEVDWW